MAELLGYEQDTGFLYWKKDRSRRAKAGDMAGWLDNDGYILVSIAGRRCKAHRVVWLLMTGAWPESDIDHINGARSDNRFANLRTASKAENAANRRTHSNNLLGLKGVCRIGKKYQARIKVRGRNKSLGVFDTPEEASSAYHSAAVKIYGEFARQS